MEINIPNIGEFQLIHLFFDYNGTIAKGGQLLPKLLEQLTQLNEHYQVHIITGDTFGTVKNTFKETSIDIIIAHTAEEKLEKIKAYPSKHVVAIGNGNIDYLMFQEARLSICVIGPEGASFKAISNADIITNNIYDTIDILNDPNKLIATLRE